MGSKTCKLISIVTCSIRGNIGQKETKKKKKEKRQLVHACPAGISSLSPQFRLIYSHEFQNHSCMFRVPMFLRFQFFYARLTLAVPFSFFLPLPLFHPISSDGVSLLHFARSRSFHAGHRSNRRWVEGCRIGRRIREIAGTMDSLASTRFTFETFLFAETRGNLAEILEKIRSRFGGSG